MLVHLTFHFTTKPKLAVNVVLVPIAGKLKDNFVLSIRNVTFRLLFLIQIFQFRNYSAEHEFELNVLNSHILVKMIAVVFKIFLLAKMLILQEMLLEIKIID